MANKEMDLLLIGRAKWVKKRYKQLWAQDRIMQEDLRGLDGGEGGEFETFYQQLEKKLAALTGSEREAFLEKVDDIYRDDVKRSVWEENHAKVSEAITKHLLHCKTMPNKSEIARLTGLSRTAVYRHIREYDTNPFYKEHEEELSYMHHKIISSLLIRALQGDLKATKLYLDAMSKSKEVSNSTIIKNQNNYIQINGTVVSQQTLEQLKPEQLKQIENIISKNIDTNK